MEQEYFFSGYCRCLDGSRMVEVVADNGRLLEADCSFEGCPYTQNCTIAAQIKELTKNN